MRHVPAWGALLLLSLQSFLFAAAQSQLSADASALLAFKEAADPEGLLENWTDAANVCDWSGVTCASDGGEERVVGLSLAEAALAEVPLPAVLGNLTALQGLDLSMNSFIGELPPFLGALRGLRTLNLAQNYFNGSLPADVLGSLTALQEIDLSVNEFAGVIPDELGSLTSLTLLNLAENQLTGSIPESLGNLQNLVTLDLGGNPESPFTGSIPSSFAKLTKLQTLGLSSNRLTGDLEDLPLATLTSLRSLSLNFNNFTGAFPSWLGRLSSLEQLDLSTNHGMTPAALPSDPASWPPTLRAVFLSQTNLVGPIPPVLGTLPSLVQLDLRGNNLTGPIPDALGQLAAPGVVLVLAVNQLSGPIPPALGNCSYAQLDLGNNTLEGDVAAFVRTLCANNRDAGFSLDLRHNRLSGELPAALGGCAQLALLDLSGNAFAGPIPAALGQLQQLGRGLFLQGNRLTGEIPSELAAVPGLTAVDLSFNELTGAIPEAFDCSRQPDLAYFAAANNSLTGGIPAGLAACESLGELLLPFNALEGPIPRQLYAAPSLVVLRLDGNRLSGKLRRVEDWRSLAELSVRGNRLEGDIPATLGRSAGALEILDLAENGLTGEVPSSLFGIPTLATLDLSDNELTGPLSPKVGGAEGLTSLKLRGNRLNGTLPLNALRNVSTLQLLDVRDNLFTGRVVLNNSRLVSILAAGNKFSGTISKALVEIPSLSQLNLSNNAFDGSIPSLPPSLTLLDLSQNTLSGRIPNSIGDLALLHTLDLSSNQLSGKLPATLTSLTALEYLDLSSNELTGEIPPDLGNLTLLSFFNVSGNRLSGLVPASLAPFGSSSFSDNAGLCGEPLGAACPASPPPAGSGPAAKSQASGWGSLSAGAKVGIIGAGVAGAVLLVVLIALVARRVGAGREAAGFKEIDTAKFSDVEKAPRAAEAAFAVSGLGQMAVFQRLEFVFGIEDVLAATEDFNDKYLLGRGGFGLVYRASIAEGNLDVAIKRLDPDSKQGEREFQAEMETLGQIRHRNLVSLLGTYSDPVSHERLLIYNFLPGGNLSSALKQGIDWPTRLNAALGSARGLKYLHHSCDPCIIHRDIKPENILLDVNMEAYVADFGLAKLIDLKVTHLSTRPLGTIGYMAPEYVAKRQITTKSDVFSFGVVLLQLVTGKSPLNPTLKNGLSHWAQSNPYADVVDPSLDFEGEKKQEMIGVLRLGILCTSRNPTDRPSMEDVVRTLENLDDFGSWLGTD